jgi:pimeloyl-ACP methyl ester carboxylesterase
MITSKPPKSSEIAFPEDLQIWRDEGRFEEIDGHKVFVHASGTSKSSGHGVLLTHGYPGSSIDWKHVVPRVALHTRVVICDFLGFGQSDKPTDGTFETHYSMFRQADRVVEVARREGLKEVVLVIHDMGQTVGAEIMARHEEGELPFTIKHAIILNGSTMVDMVNFMPLQQEMLAAPDTVLDEDIPDEKWEGLIQSSFSKEHQPNDGLLEVMVAQINYHHGGRLMPRLMRYQQERKDNLQRWIDGLTKLSAPTSIFWGVQDPNGVVAMADRLKKLNPSADLHKWPDVSHWPPIEVPERVAKAITDRL